MGKKRNNDSKNKELKNENSLHKTPDNQRKDEAGEKDEKQDSEETIVHESIKNEESNKKKSKEEKENGQTSGERELKEVNGKERDKITNVDDSIVNKK